MIFANYQYKAILSILDQYILVMLRFGFIDFDRFRFDFSINNKISIRFGFDFLRSAHLCWLNSIRVWPRGNGSAAVLAAHEAIPPPLPSSSAWTGKMLSGQSTDQTVWRCDMELKLPSWTARRHTLTLSIVLAPCGRCLLSDVQTSHTLVNRPTCLRAYNTRGWR